MGIIADNVKIMLEKVPVIYEFIKLFSKQFDITKYEVKDVGNSQYHAFYIKPNQTMSDRIDIKREILLLYVPYTEFQVRSFDIAKLIVNQNRDRIETYCAFLVSESKDIYDLLHDYHVFNPQPVIVPFIRKDIISNKDDNYYITKVLEKYIWDVDLFYSLLPLLADNPYYYGREDIINDFIYKLRNGQNCGLFGLRKMGKTSLLRRLENHLICMDYIVIFYNCKELGFYNWIDLLNLITKDVCKKLGTYFNEIKDVGIVAHFKNVIKDTPKRVILLFDEIEVLSFLNKLDKHWENDFFHFWSVMWSIQSEYRHLNFIICGVNPYIVELDRIKTNQNPLFNIISTTYLTSLKENDVEKMLVVIGKKMGLRFDKDAIGFIYDKYGGHPLLTRLACSFLHKSIKDTQENRPFTVKKNDIMKKENEIDELLVHYCIHIISELKDYYTDEYEMLELLATGRIGDFCELNKDETLTAHLYSYGILNNIDRENPKFTIPILEKYIGLESKKRNNRLSTFAVVAQNIRKNWISNRMTYIIKDVCNFEYFLCKNSKQPLYGQYGLPLSHDLVDICIVKDVATFSRFIDIMYNSFVEPLKKGKPDGYFFSTIRSLYPFLFDALNRINAYRNRKDHLILDKTANDCYLSYISRDMDSQDPSCVVDGYFRLQQIIIDNIFASLQMEIRKLD